MQKLVTAKYDSTTLSFTEDGWFNATQAAAKYGKAPAEWMRLPSTIEYIEALKRHNPSMGKSHRSKSGPLATGGGTWLHPKLAVAFARWLDPDFSVWCDAQIDNLVRSKTDWSKLRHEAASSFKVMNAVMQLQRQMQGKPTAPHHFSNEARLINWALTGDFVSLDRNSLHTQELDMLAKLEERNAVLMGCGLDYATRKQALERFATEWREKTAVLSA